MNATRRVGRFALAALVLAGGGVRAEDEPKKNAKFPQLILIIRHAEKTGDKADIHLSKKGVERADALSMIFEKSKERPDPFPTPDVIFAASPSKDSNRPIETVTPLAKKLKLTIGDKYTSKVTAASPDDKDKTAKVPGMNELRDELFGDAKYAGKTVLISWRHSTIPELAKTLKATSAPTTWPDDVFDRVWQITYDDKGNATFLDRPMRLLAGDAEK